MTIKSSFYGITYDPFKCRICKACFSNPDELRMHSMVKHKGHMLLKIKAE